jgi:IS30 family transposase
MKNYKRLNLSEREMIADLKQQGMSNKSIGKKLERSPTTILRELKRNKIDLGYLPHIADSKAKARKHGPPKKIKKYPELLKYLVDRLREGWSPEMIAGRIKLEKVLPTISHEVLYQCIYSDQGRDLGLYKFLMMARPKRGKFYSRKHRTNIPERVSISERPVNIENRSEIGHWESDLTFFKGNQSQNIGIAVERVTRFMLLVKNQSKKSTEVMKNLFNSMAQLPQEMRKSTTMDNGTEFTLHALLKQLNMNTYFCNPHSPWQKGLVENSNARLHRFMPKNSSLSNVSQKHVNKLQDKMNNLPRKCLGFKTPLEVFSNYFNQGGVH